VDACGFSDKQVIHMACVTVFVIQLLLAAYCLH